MKRIIENYGKPTPPEWRKVGDLAMFMIPVIEAQFATMPESDNVQLAWFKWAVVTLLVLFKAWTNTKTYEDNQNRN